MVKTNCAATRRDIGPSSLVALAFGNGDGDGTRTDADGRDRAGSGDAGCCEFARVRGWRGPGAAGGHAAGVRRSCPLRGPRCMLTIASGARVYLASQAVDLRRGHPMCHDGLCALVRGTLELDPAARRFCAARRGLNRPTSRFLDGDVDPRTVTVQRRSN